MQFGSSEVAMCDLQVNSQHEIPTLSKLAYHPLLDLLQVCFILLQRSLIEGRLASMDRKTSNTLGSTAIRESTAASSFEVLSPLSCIVLLTASRTAGEMTFSAYSSHARTSGSCMTVSRSAECFRNASQAGLKFPPPLAAAMVEFENQVEGAGSPTFRCKISELPSEAESCECWCLSVMIQEEQLTQGYMWG